MTLLLDGRGEAHNWGMDAVAPPASPQGLSVREQLMIRLYTDLQLARYNELYYGIRAASARRLALGMNVLSALASCGALTGILNGFAIGSKFVGLLTLAAAICASVGPIFGLEAKAARLETAAFGYATVRERIKRLLSDLKIAEILPEHHARDREIESFRSSLGALDESPHRKTCERAWAQTEMELPADSAWELV